MTTTTEIFIPTHVDDNEWDKELEDNSEDEDVGTESKQRKEIGSPIGDFLLNWYYFSSL